MISLATGILSWSCLPLPASVLQQHVAALEQTLALKTAHPPRQEPQAPQQLSFYTFLLNVDDAGVVLEMQL